MRYIEFRVQNYRGIKDETLKLKLTPDLKIFTLVGLNESGKTSFLEAVNSFQNGIKNKDTVIPKDKKMNFNDSIVVTATVSLDENDEKKVKEFCTKQGFALKENVGTIKVERKLVYKASKPEGKGQVKSNWTINLTGNRTGSRKKDSERLYDASNEIWQDTVSYIERSIFPKIILYSNFLFEIPPKMYLAKKNKDEATTPKHLLASDDQYFLLIQDVLDSLGQGLKIEEHLVNRYLSGDPEDLDNINQVLNAMSAKVTEEVFQAWGRVSGININGREVTFGDSIKEDDNGYYLELKIKEGSKTYSVQERSLGFRWFFAFLMFTQFRKFRENEPANTLFLFDEPASNLHQTGQQELLTVLEALTDRSAVIYSTHSHHLISPKWLSGAYIVKNNAIDPNAKAITGVMSVKPADIKVSRYFDFAAQSPKQETHFQPILDVLEYRPGSLEQVPEIIVLEGKFDYYNFSYYSFCKGQKLNYYPGNGAGSLDKIIALYLAWGRKFVVVLDGDSAGKREKNRYINEFGEIVKDRIYSLGDIDPAFDNLTTEGLTSSNDKDAIIKKVYGPSATYEKSLFNTALQQLYINGDKFTFAKETKQNFDKVITFMKKKSAS